MQFSITISPEQIAKLEAAIGKQSTKQAIYQAVLRTTRAGTTIFRKRITEKLYLDQKYITRAITTDVRGLSRDSAEAVGHIRVSAEPIPIVAYQDRKAGKQGGITVVISKDRPPLYLRHAFYARVGTGGHVGIFFRAEGRDKSAGKERFIVSGGRIAQRYKHGGKLTASGYARRLPMEEKFGPSVVDAYGDKVLTTMGQQINVDLQETLVKNLQSQLDRFQGGAGGAN